MVKSCLAVGQKDDSLGFSPAGCLKGWMSEKALCRTSVHTGGRPSLPSATGHFRGLSVQSTLWSSSAPPVKGRKENVLVSGKSCTAGNLATLLLWQPEQLFFFLRGSHAPCQSVGCVCVPPMSVYGTEDTRFLSERGQPST